MHLTFENWGGGGGGGVVYVVLCGCNGRRGRGKGRITYSKIEGWSFFFCYHVFVYFIRWAWDGY